MLLIWEAAPSKYECVRFDGVRGFTVEGLSEVTQHPLEDGSSATDHVFAKPRTITIEGIITNTPAPRALDPTIAARYPGAAVFPSAADKQMAQQSVRLSLGGEAPEKFSQRTIKLDLPKPPVKIGNPIGKAKDFLQAQAMGLLRIPGANVDRATVGVPSRENPSASASLFVTTSYKDRALETYEALERARLSAKFVRVETGGAGDLENMLITGVTFPREDSKKRIILNVSLEQVLIVSALTVESPKPAEPMGQQQKAAGSKSTKEDDAAKDDAKKRSLAKRAIAGIMGE